jgi:hypothetical protein
MISIRFFAGFFERRWGSLGFKLRSGRTARVQRIRTGGAASYWAALAMISARRLPIFALAGFALVLGLSGCTAIKPGSVALTQPAGIGPLSLRLSFCTTVPSEPTVVCGSEAEASSGQMLLALIVPVGSTVPATIVAVPSPGSSAATLTRSQEVAQAFNAVSENPVPPGFEIVGYISGTVAEAAGQTSEWALAAELRQPTSADGGSYGLPVSAGVRSGWREVTPEQPASRPVKCITSAEILPGPAAPGVAWCESGTGAANEVTLGISDLKVKSPPPTTVAPGARVKLPFVLDFASSATKLPKFKLTVGSNLPGTGLSVSNNSFSRGPSNQANNRAPATTRQVIVPVPRTARLGTYEVGLTATAAQGGAVRATAQLVVKPGGRAKVTVPKQVKASLASSKGIPVTLTSPIAGTRFKVVLKGPTRLREKTRVAKSAEQISLRFRLPGPKAQALLEAGERLTLEVKVNQPGTRKPLRLVRSLQLR